MAEAATPTAEASADHTRPEDLAPGWDAQLPADPETRREAFRELYDRQARLKEETDDAKERANVAGAKKTLTKVYGYHKHVVAFAERMHSVTPEERAKIWRQLVTLEADENWDPQRDLFDIAAVGKTTAPDEPSVFDSTHAGETVDAERGDDPGRARKRASKKAPQNITENITADVGTAGLAAGIKQLNGGVPPPTPEELDNIPPGAERRRSRVGLGPDAIH